MKVLMIVLLCILMMVCLIGGIGLGNEFSKAGAMIGAVLGCGVFFLTLKLIDFDAIKAREEAAYRERVDKEVAVRKERIEKEKIRKLESNRNRSANSKIKHNLISEQETSDNYEGCVYCLSNPAMVGIYKVGYTKFCPFKRAEDLYKGRDGSGTGVPLPFEVEFYFKCLDPFYAEHLLHVKLDSCRINSKREYFRIDLQKLKQVFYANIPEPFEFVQGGKSPKSG